jgi:hypothetical protein
MEYNNDDLKEKFLDKESPERTSNKKLPPTVNKIINTNLNNSILVLSVL